MKYSTCSHSEIYNGLPDVLVADAKLKAMGKAVTLTPLCEAILKHGLEDRIGIRLLHNHNKIAQDEMMVEQEELNRDGTYCLTTVAVDKASYATKSYANSWLLRKDGPLPLEYSLDPLVVAQSDELISKDRFIGEIQQNLEQLDASDLLGLCVLNRRFYEERRPSGGKEVQLVETTDGERRANVLKFYCDGRFNLDELIETVWMASREEGGLETLLTCTSKPFCSPTWVIHCNTGNDGKHDGTSTTTPGPHGKGTEHTN
jgi:hypothetical protein